MTKRLMRPGQTIRYTKQIDVDSPIIDGAANFHWLMADPADRDAPLPRLERGIDAPAVVTDPNGDHRRPLVSCRTSSHKAGSEATPWVDTFDRERGSIIYYGDQRSSSTVHHRDSVGNRRLIEAYELHESDSRIDRAAAPPILAFSFPRKGFGRFLGVCVITELRDVRQVDADGRPFINLRADLTILDTGVIDPRWFDDRRDPHVPNEWAMRHAPQAWRLWVDGGHELLSSLRRTAI